MTTTADVLDPSDGLLSLREAIIEANTLPGADTILVPAGTYNLTRAGAGEDAALTGDLDITDDLTITGAGAPGTVVDANFLDRAFHVLGADVTITGLTITHGLAEGDNGGGIFNAGVLTVDACTISGNSARRIIFGPGGAGGGIFNWDGAVTVRASSFLGNSAEGGGGIYNGIGTLRLDATTFSDNTADVGGGVVTYGRAAIDASTFIGNRAGQGAGINNGGMLSVTASTFSGNSAQYGGGITNFGTLTVRDCTLTGNSASVWGGGIFSAGSRQVTIVVGSTVLDNSAPFGADIAYSGGKLVLADSTVGDIFEFGVLASVTTP